jgi:Ni,Fe-hydrogenase III large subunit
MNAIDSFASLRTGQALPREQVPNVPFDQFRRAVTDGVKSGQRVAAFFGDVSGSSSGVDVLAVLSDGARSLLRVIATRLDADHFESLTNDCTQVHLFERELAEQYGVIPEGHPWFKPVRYHRSYRPGHDAWHAAQDGGPVVGVTEFFRVFGEEVHQVAVGPVHAGVIEPGHFRFQCHGEEVFHLEISLGYQHRGIERALIGGPDKRTVHLVEQAAGDTSVGHATAYCQAVEALTSCLPSIRAQAIRGIALELERLANHTGDLGALAGDVGFLPTASYCGRIRGDFLNLTALLCGSRFGRGLVRPGGVRFDLDQERIQLALSRLNAAYRDVAGAVNLLWDSLSVQARFEETGAITRDTASALGLVGPAARACGLERDVRQDFPSEIFRFAQVPISTWTTGDVFARAYVRWLEIQRSVEFIEEQLRAFPAGPVVPDAMPGPLKANRLAVSLVEGWRGEICHVALTDSQGRFARYKIVDPSFHNWTGLVMALRNQQISDFPLCNKSFNLSYCGHDL